MKITVKTTQQKVFQVDAEPSDTIADLKAKIESSQAHPVASQKIIYSGKILADDKTVESCGIKEKDFLVLMVSKPKPTPTPAPATSSTLAPSAPPPVTEAAPPPTSESTSTTSAPSAPAPPASSEPVQERAFGDTSSFLSGPALQATINNMVEMGFPKDQVLKAMRASFNNPDRAVEYLMTGIPSHLEAEASGNAQGGGGAQGGAQGGTQGGALPRAPPTVPAATSPAPAVPPPNQPQNLFQLAQNQQQSGGGNAGGFSSAQGQHIDIEALRNNPQIQQLREVIAQNPDSAQAIIQQLAAHNPQLIQVLAQNPDALMRLLDLDSQSVAPPGAQVINVTEEERAAIERLEAFGFPRHRVVEAYLACDRDETMAANYLFEHGYEDDDDN